MTLYNKYRPDNFDDMVGNKEAIGVLKGVLSKQDHPHVFLFSGPSGTGKTTAARIMAKQLEASELDIREINSSSNRGIDTARDIKEQMRRMPQVGKHVVYIIDEVHKATPDFQNAMLKPCEDTPEHVYFFFCTTEPKKLIPPLRNRCTKVQMKSLPAESILLVLRRVNKLEKLEIDNDMLLDIADISEGSSRNALVLLEKVASVDEWALRNTIIMMGVPNQDDAETIEVCRYLLDKNKGWADIAPLLKKLKDDGKLSEPESIRYMVLGYMSTVLLGGKKNLRAIAALEAFAEPTYNTGVSGIILACLSTIL